MNMFMMDAVTHSVPDKLVIDIMSNDLSHLGSTAPIQQVTHIIKLI